MNGRHIVLKVLYLNNYREGTGWSNAGLNYILALHKAGVDVVCRHLEFSGNHTPVPAIIDELERKELSGCTHVIQHTLPHLYEYRGGMKNICMFETETNNFLPSGWDKYINLMDEVWVPNNQMVEACRDSYISHQIPVHVVPHCLDMQKYEDAPMGQIGDDPDTFHFIFVGEWNRRKNYAALIRAFHAEFHPSENAELIIKTSIPGEDANKTMDIVHNTCREIKKGLGYRKAYRKDKVLAGYIDERELLGLIKACNCFVMPSYGEAWSIPALEGMAMGLPVIYTSGIGTEQFAVGYPVEAQWDDCFGMQQSIDGLHTCEELWRVINVRDLRRALREAYETHRRNSTIWDFKCEEAIERAQDFDHAPIGQLMKGLLV